MKKKNRKPELTFFQIRHTDGHRNMNKRFNITNHQRSKNQTTIRLHLIPVKMVSVKSLQGFFPGGSMVKNPSANAADIGSIRPPEGSHMSWNN